MSINPKKQIAKKSVLLEKCNNLAQRFLPSYAKSKKTYISGGILIIASFLANFLNYLFNAYLGRILSFSDFSLIGLISGFYSVATILFGAFSLTVNYRSSFLIGKYDNNAAFKFWKYISKRVRYPSFILTGIWLLLTPLLMQFFHTNNVFLFIFFGVVLFVGFTTFINQGYLSAKMMFGSLAAMTLTDPISKLLLTFLLVFVGLKTWTFSAIPFSSFCVFIITWILLSQKLPKGETKATRSEIEYFSKRFFLVSVLSGISSVAYFTLDIFMAKHFLSATDAGRYTLVTLVGKMIFFLGRLTAPFVVPLIGRYEGANKSSLRAMYMLLLSTSILSFIGFILFGVLGFITVPLLYGVKAISIVSYLSVYTFGMLCYTVSSIMVSYYLVRKIYTFTIAPFFIIFFQFGLLLVFHNTIGSIVNVMSFVLVANLFLTLLLHFSIDKVVLFEKKVTKFLDNSHIKAIKKRKSI